MNRVFSLKFKLKCLLNFMLNFKINIAFSILVLASSRLFAATPAFSSLTQSDFDNITKEMAGNFSHHSLLGASSLGAIFGFEFGLILGQEKSPDTDAVVKRSSPGSELPNLYHTGLLAAVSVPFGITGELVMVPKTNMSDTEFQYTSLAVKWTMNQDVLKIIPFNLALRGTYSTSNFSFKQSIAGFNATVEDKNTVTGLQILASPSLPLFEPYVGIGTLNANNTLSVSGTTGTIFDSAFSNAQSADSSANSIQYILGADVRLLFIVLGAEYSNAFGASTYTAKLSTRF